MKILQVHDKHGKNDSIGGVQRYLDELEEGLGRRGHRIVRVRLARNAGQVRQEAAGYVTATSQGLRQGWRAARGLRQIVAAEKPDVVHLHSVFTTMAPGVVRLLGRLRATVFTLHDVTPLCYWGTKIVPATRQPCISPVGWRCVQQRCYSPLSTASPVKNLLRMPLRHALLRAYRDLHLMVANRFFHQELLRLGFDETRLALIPLPTDPGPADDDVSDPSADKHLLFVGRLSEEKGVLSFLQMLARLAHRDWTAEIVGDGPQEQEARRTTAQLGLGDRVRFRGRVDPADMTPLYRSCRALVMASAVPENFGLAGVEALAQGRPVVAFGIAGVLEWLDDGINGFAVPYGDLDAMAERVGRLLDDPALAASLGREGRRSVRERLGTDEHARRVEEVYEAARARGPRT